MLKPFGQLQYLEYRIVAIKSKTHHFELCFSQINSNKKTNYELVINNMYMPPTLSVLGIAYWYSYECYIITTCTNTEYDASLNHLLLFRSFPWFHEYQNILCHNNIFYYFFKHVGLKKMFFEHPAERQNGYDIYRYGNIILSEPIFSFPWILWWRNPHSGFRKLHRPVIVQ